MQARRTILDPETLPEAGARWDWAITGLLAALFAFAPAAFGGIEPWSELVVLILAGALALCLAVRVAVDRDFRPRWTWLYVPAMIMAFLALLQISPLPMGIVHAVAPSSVELRRQLMGDAFAGAQSTTISLYPHATAEQLRLLFVGITVFVVVANMYRSTRSIKLLLTIIFLIGCAEGILALAQLVTRSDAYYWLIPSGRRIVTSGSFVNYSNFAQFMNLSLGAGLGLLLIRIAEQTRNRFPVDGLPATARRLWETQNWVFAGLAIGALAVLSSMSRNGVISLLVASLIVGVALYRRGALGWGGWALAALPAAVVAVLLCFGFDALYVRLSSLHASDSYDTRLDMTAATLRAWAQFPLWGAGLGTHEFVFPMFDTSPTPTLAAHADNDYAQLFEEMGLAGALVAGAFFVGIAMLAARVIIRGRSSLALAVYGLLFGLIAVAVHSATDFGQRLPANFCLTATFCGLILSIARHERQRTGSRARSAERQPAANSAWVRRCAGGVTAVGVAFVFGTSIYFEYRAYLADRWSTAAAFIATQIRDRKFETTDEDYMELLSAAEEAANAAPADANYAYWLNYYRWMSLQATVEADNRPMALRTDEMPYVQQIADELRAARPLCPTFGPPYALEGQLRLFVLQDSKGAELIRQGVRLAPHDPTTCLVAGELSARDGHMDEAQPLLARAVEFNPSYFGEVANLYVVELKQYELARALAGDDYHRLKELARLAEATGDGPRAAELNAEVEKTLRRRATMPNVQADELAQLAQIDQAHGERASAIDLYRRALALDYPRIDWRLSLARVLGDSGSLEEAIREVRLALRLRPHDEGATHLLEQLTEQFELRGAGEAAK
ncbi:MAG: O-antigen ligase family protein [Pirellulales bacterium]